MKNTKELIDELQRRVGELTQLVTKLQEQHAKDILIVQEKFAEQLAAQHDEVVRVRTELEQIYKGDRLRRIAANKVFKSE